jgi:hypothetical protein
MTVIVTGAAFASVSITMFPQLVCNVKYFGARFITFSGAGNRMGDCADALLTLHLTFFAGAATLISLLSALTGAIGIKSTAESRAITVTLRLLLTLSTPTQ